MSLNLENVSVEGNGAVKLELESLLENKVDNHVENASTLSWQDVNVYLPVSEGSCLKKLKGNHSVQRKHIIKDISGIAKANEVLAIMGSSGAGKTTLLNILNFRNLSALQVTGDIKINGKSLRSIEQIMSISGYVQQNDLFIATLKVKEHLFFQAMLRMDKITSQEERLKRITEVLDDFNLSKCKDSLIGSPERGIKGISGGEMRRLSFASEIITNPPILFCDEPTSGLDSFMAMSIVESMRNLARSGKTIICTIHQPSSELFEMFDRICFLSEGRLAYIGSQLKAIQFFDQNGFKCPDKYNPADFFIKTLSIAPQEKEKSLQRVIKICEGFEKSEYSRDLQNEISAVSDAQLSLPTSAEVEKSSILTQIRWLFWRNYLDFSRDPLILKLQFMQTIFIGVLYGLIFFRLELTQEGIQNINGVLFISVINATFGALFGVINTFPKEIPLFVRESQNGIYKVFSYFISKVMIEFPTHFLIPLIMITILYWMTNLNNELERFIVCCVVIVQVAYVSGGYSQVISLMSSSNTGPTELAAPLIIPFFIFSGFFLHNNSVPKYLLFIKYLSWFGYANEALLINQWSGNVTIECDKLPQLCFLSGKDVLGYFNAQPENLGYNLGMLLYLIMGFKVLTLIALLIRSYKK